MLWRTAVTATIIRHGVMSTPPSANDAFDQNLEGARWEISLPSWLLRLWAQDPPIHGGVAYDGNALRLLFLCLGSVGLHLDLCASSPPCWSKPKRAGGPVRQARSTEQRIFARARRRAMQGHEKHGLMLRVVFALVHARARAVGPYNAHSVRNAAKNLHVVCLNRRVMRGKKKEFANPTMQRFSVASVRSSMPFDVARVLPELHVLQSLTPV